MTAPNHDQEKLLRERELRVQRQIAFASGLFQGDVTVRTLLESLAEGVVIIDNSGTILLVNTAAEKMFGYPRQDLIGQPHAILVPERFRQVHGEHEAHYFAEPRIRPMGQLLELAGRHRDGSEFPVEISLGFIDTINGVLVIALVSNMTLRKQFEMRLQESEELFHVQMECVKDHAVFMLDPQGNVLNWNAGAERLEGYSAEEIIGKHFSCFYPTAERSSGKLGEYLTTAAAEGRFAGEGWQVRKDGSQFWADVIITAIRDENGNLRGFSKVTRDSSERKRVVDALHFSEERYRTLFRDNPTMIVTLDADLTMLTVNPICACQLGYLIEELEGRSVLKLFHENDHPAVIKQLRLCLQNPDQVFHWQFRKIRKDGEMLWVEETAQAVYDLGGALNILVVCQDITVRKHMEDELKKISLQNELILTSAGEGIVGLDLDGNQTFVNTAAAAMLGYEVNELVGKQSHATWHYARSDGSHYPTEQCPVYAAYKDGVVHSGEDLFLRKDGTGFPVHFNSRPIYSDGKIAGAVLTFNDITERKGIEEALRKSEERFRATFDQAAMGIGHVGPDGSMLRINRKYCDIVGYSEEELKTMTIQEITHPDDCEASMRHFQQMLEGKLGSYALEKRYVRKDGSIVWVNLTVSTVVSPSGELSFAVGVVEDITARKQAEEEIERLNASLTARAADLDAVNRDLEDFSYAVSNDLLNSLLTIGSHAKTIQELVCSTQDDRCRTYTRQIYEKTKHLGELIGVMHDFFRPMRIEIHPETFDLSQMAGRTAERLQLTRPERQVRFLINEGIIVNGDRKLLQLVLDNLLGNAWKHTARREEAIIEFGATDIEGKQVLFVRDNGIGFDMQHADALFKPFRSLPGTEEFRESGIGLATVERVIRRHGGRIWAEGDPGVGAVFYFSL